MQLNDFRSAVALLNVEPLCTPLTLFLQGGLSVTGTWDWLNPNAPSAVIVEEASGVRNVVSIETITSLRENRTGPRSYRYDHAQRKLIDART